jgi:predicted GNAT family acetyltransferase
MIDNTDQSHFELEEGGHLAWAEYRIRDGQVIISHVEAEPPLRGTGAAGRLMQQITDHVRANQLVIVPRCSYARSWFQRHPQAGDVLA